METGKINSIIINYIKNNLYPTKQEQEFISKKYNQLQNILEGRTFQNGSYARHTSTTPVNDLDVFYVLSDQDYIKYKKLLLERKAFSIDDILKDLYKFLSDEYGNLATIKLQSHSIGIFFGSDDDFSIDVVPALPNDEGMFWVPESSHLSIIKRRKLYETLSTGDITWIKSDPKGYIQDASDIDNLTKNNFRKSVKFIKKWKIASKKLDKRFPVKSFHMELIVNKACKENSNLLCYSYIKNFFLTLEEYLNKPNFPDRADPLRFIDEYIVSLEELERNLVIQFKDDANKIINDIDSAETEQEVKNLIDILLGIIKAPPKEKGYPAFSKPYTY